ncbi:branched-chain amino acid transport system II carrier protein [Legionella oakridgensis]|uniref:Branched-chain amino acid transport system carrier protein n=2 Tax=Legionella oakridgensis TaxID=29423 RepID=W0B5X4_9GAMM|nr:branched-chain amino acid transport system II carrier protein [Legionella oakridgensis]AHE65923.1 branched-chain amino acid permease [Legionella oakridgensis ATCC 33761 = DSM 21215]ETO94298.1 branched-chain amino acid permease [Legionella oakridgensis RV-2-2007]KTD43776.1 Branched-chain amino acid transport system 2 carrier protein [Legionella oakridgensis]STY15854.1 LIV-II [Legionella longbeachae]
MPQIRSMLMYGFAMFAMFFGSGNLVFPLQIGYENGDHWLLGFAGLLITGIILPFLGLFVIKLHQGNYQSFFGGAGRLAQVVLPFAMLSLLGSFGVVPRCITVAYGSMDYMMPGMSLMTFSFLFCLAMYLVCLNDRWMVNILGKWMSPVLLIILIILTAMAIFHSPEPTSHHKAKEAFATGFLTGYQTMDLFAAFFFSALTFTQIQNKLPAGTSSQELIRFAIKSSLIAAILLAMIYLGFVYLGAHYSFLIQDVPAESMLPTIAFYTMGKKATTLIGFAMLFSCLSTAIALNNLYARYLCNLFNLKENKFYRVVLLTTGIAFIISLFDFRGIAAFLQPILEAFYPGIIGLVLISIVIKRHQPLKMYLFYIITLITISYSYLK